MNCFFLLDMSVKTCEKYLSIFKMIAIIENTMVFWLGIVLPLIMIIIGIISLIKAIVTKKELKKYIKKLFKSITLAILLFFTSITINLMSNGGICDVYSENGVEYQDTGCWQNVKKEKLQKKEARMFEFLVAVFVISFIFKKKNRKTVEKTTNF